MIWYNLYRLRMCFRKIMRRLGWVPVSELEHLLELMKDLKE